MLIYYEILFVEKNFDLIFFLNFYDKKAMEIKKVLEKTICYWFFGEIKERELWFQSDPIKKELINKYIILS